MIVHAYTDGASRGNPGESGIGIIIKDEKGKVILKLAASIGLATNNLAEYSALLTLLKRMKGIDCQRLIVHSDSELMVRQMNGKYRIKNPEISKYYGEIQRILRTSPFAFEIRHIPREANHEADQLANEGIESRARLEDNLAGSR